MKPEPLEVSALDWTTLLLGGAALYLCWPLWPSLVLAAWTAALARPLQRRLEKWLRGRRRAAEVLALLVFLLLAIPVALVVVGIIAGAQDLARAVAASTSTKTALEAIAAGGSESAIATASLSIPGLISLAQRYGAQGLPMLSNLAGVAAEGLVAVFIYFAGAYAFLVDTGEAWSWARRHAPMRPEHLDRFAAAFHETGRGLLVGVGLTTITQGLMATAIYGAMGVPRWWVLGPITGVASMIPVIGSTLVWGPIALGLLLGGHTVKALILLGLGLGVISTVDNLLRPLYARLGSLKMPTLLLFVSIFGGLMAFGSWGALLGPLIIRLLMAATELRRELATERAPRS